MYTVMLPGASSIATSTASIFDSVSRIVSSNNWRDVELAAIECTTDISCKEISMKAELDKRKINIHRDQSINALNSPKLTSTQKKEFVLHSVRAINSI